MSTVLGLNPLIGSSSKSPLDLDLVFGLKARISQVFKAKMAGLWSDFETDRMFK